MSQRRRELAAKRKTKKEARMKSPGRESVYARKKQGIFPPNSPYLTGDWGVAMRKLRAGSPIIAVQRYLPEEDAFHG